MSGSISHEKAMTESATQAATEIHRTRIWDLPTRLFHWTLAAAVIAGLPTMLIYMLAGQYFVKGLTAGAVKG